LTCSLKITGSSLKPVTPPVTALATASLLHQAAGTQ